MVRRSSSFFSPTRHTSQPAARRRSLPLAPHVAGASPSSAPWTRRETAQLVAAWRDVAEHPASARESVDAFQTRLFLRFQEVTAAASGDADDVISMAGSECSMESVEFADTSTSSSSSSSGSSGGTLFSPRARTQTSVVLRTYALRRMAGFITAFLAQQEALKQQQQQQSGAQPMEDIVATSDSQEPEADAPPVDWFALSKNNQIERFQAAGATSYIELDEHMYQTILTTLELQDKCKQEKAPPVANNGNDTAESGASATSSASQWTEQEVRHVLAAWRETHLRTPTRLPGADSFYARFLALNGETSQRSKPEVADMKIALLNMHGVVTTFHHRTPANGKLTRGNLKRQRQNWFALSLAERQRAFSEGRSNQGCGFVDISEDMYATISELVAASPPNDARDTGKRRNSLESSAHPVIKSEATSAPVQMIRSGQRDTIDLISDDECDDEHAALSASQLSLGDDVDMGDAGADCSLDNSEDHASYGDNQDAGTVADAAASARVASEAAAKLVADLKTEVHSSSDDGAVKPPTDEHTVNEDGRTRQNSLKKQKLKHHHAVADASEIAVLLEKQAQELNALVLQVQEDREREREEREKLLLVMKVDQQGRDAVIALLRAEQDERRRDREERRQMLQLLMREQQELQRKHGADGTSAADAKVCVKNEDAL